MADAETKSFPPVTLLANSYNFGDLLKATNAAHALKDDGKRAEAIAELPEKLALNQAVLADADAIAVPEGHKLASVEDAQGRIVLAPVPMTEQDMKDFDAEAAARAKEAGAPPPPPLAEQLASAGAGAETGAERGAVDKA